MTPHEVIARWAALPLQTRASILESLPDNQQEVLEPFMEALAADEKPDLAAIGASLDPPISRTSVLSRLKTAARHIADLL